MQSGEVGSGGVPTDSAAATADALDRPGWVGRGWRGSLTVRTTALAVVVLLAGLAIFSIFSYAILASTVRTSTEASALTASSLLANRLRGKLLSGDAIGSRRLAESMLEIEEMGMIGVRARRADGILLFETAQAERPDIFDRLAFEAVIPLKPTIASDGSVTFVRFPVRPPADPAADPIGALEVAFDRTAALATIRAEAGLLVLASIALTIVVGGGIYGLLHIQVGRLLRRTIEAMDAIAQDRSDVDMPLTGSSEARTMHHALNVFRDQIGERLAYAARSAEAEARALELQEERRRSIDADREAEEARARDAQAAARREIADQQLLQRDLRDLLTAAFQGDFSVRMPLDGAPQIQRSLREMINALLEGIDRGIEDVIGIMIELERGHLGVRMDGVRAGAFARLQTSTNAMAMQLEAALSELSSHATGILDDTSDLSSSAEELSKRTERTAGSLAETTNALEQIVGSIAATAELTAGAKVSAHSAREEAIQSDRVVRDAVRSMEEIQAISNEISRTLGVINDIAFQTNLLALNAGVEAARAGEAGRGFAVVASEVRALAQRASDAAQRIGELIATNSERIDEGVLRVGQTGKTLAILGDSIQQIGDQVDDIAHAAEQQSTAAAEINRAMSEIDDATQQNTAMFEEVTTANLSLKGAASQMLQLIERFELRSGASGLASPSGNPPGSGDAMDHRAIFGEAELRRTFRQ